MDQQEDTPTTDQPEEIGEDSIRVEGYEELSEDENKWLIG